MHQGHAALERLLHGIATGDGERNRTQLLAAIKWMMVVVVGLQRAST
jgi:hypothetical protein